MSQELPLGELGLPPPKLGSIVQLTVLESLCGSRDQLRFLPSSSIIYNLFVMTYGRNINEEYVVPSLQDARSPKVEADIQQITAML